MNIILLSGGSGKRRWPLSNDVRSRQFFKLFKDKNGEYESMVQWVYRKITTVVNLWDDPTKAKTKSGWNPQKTNYRQLCAIMAEHDLQLAKKEAGLK